MTATEENGRGIWPETVLSRVKDPAGVKDHCFMVAPNTEPCDYSSQYSAPRYGSRGMFGN